MSLKVEVKTLKIISIIDKRMCEPLDVKNIIELELIRSLILKENQELLTMFELLVTTANISINKTDKTWVKKIIIEECIEPDLESDSEDDLLIED